MAAGGVCALAVLCVLMTAPAGWAQARGAGARSTDEVVDIALNAVEGPVVQPLLVPPGIQRGIPGFPPYKQEPPAAQRDFRGLASPASTPPPAPGKAPGTQPGGGTGSGSGGGQPGTATGSGGGSPPPSPPPGQFPPPNIDPTPPNVLPPPGPGLPPLPPGPFLRPARAR
jgi:hypothetical protein